MDDQETSASDKRQCVYVTRDGKRVSPALPDENAAYAWLLRHQGQSTHYATTYGGYGFEEVSTGGEPS